MVRNCRTWDSNKAFCQGVASWSDISILRSSELWYGCNL